MDKKIKKTNKRTEEETRKIIEYKAKFINNFRFMFSSLSELTVNLSNNIHKKRMSEPYV